MRAVSFFVGRRPEAERDAFPRIRTGTTVGLCRSAEPFSVRIRCFPITASLLRRASCPCETNVVFGGKAGGRARSAVWGDGSPPASYGGAECFPSLLGRYLAGWGGTPGHVSDRGRRRLRGDRIGSSAPEGRGRPFRCGERRTVGIDPRIGAGRRLRCRGKNRFLFRRNSSGSPCFFCFSGKSP